MALSRSTRLRGVTVFARRGVRLRFVLEAGP
jgi:hypothetical protein